MLTTVNVSAIKKAGITDLFITTSKTDVEGTLVPFLNKFKGSGIRIHAWVSCFKYNGEWYDPGTSPVKVQQLMNSIISISTNYNIAGIHLDSVRYPGTAYKHDGTTHVTSFVKNVSIAIQKINNKAIDGKPQILLSAALMPECGGNGYYYGQDYGKLAPYLDFLVPMIYKGNYGASTEWIGKTTKYIVEAACEKPVVAGIQTYRSDAYPIPISSSEINKDIEAALDNGSSGYVLFKYGLTDTSISGVPFYSRTDLGNILVTATKVKTSVEKYSKIPSKAILTSSLADEIDMPTFLYLLTKGLTNINTGKSSYSIRVIDYNNPSNPTNTVKSGSLTKSEYLNIATKILNYMKSYGCAPNYVSTSLGNIPYQNLIYTYSKIMNYYSTNNVLPSSVSIKPLLWPSIKNTSPTSNAKNVIVTSPIIITFNEKINNSTKYSGIYVINTATKSKITISKIISGNTLTIKTSSKQYNTTYQVYIPDGAVKNSIGNNLITAYTYKFTTMPKETTPPIISKTSPANGATGYSITAPITITFSEKIVASTYFSRIYIKNLNTGKKVSLASKIIKGTVLTIKMTYSRLSKNTYQVYIPARALKDLCGNNLTSYYTFKFKTA